MKLIVIAALVAAATAARLENTYLPPKNARTAGGSGTFLATPFNQGSATGFKTSLARPTSFGGANAFIASSGFGTPSFSSASGFRNPNFGVSNFGKSSFASVPAPQYDLPAGAQGYLGQFGGRQIAILRSNNENNGDGSYHFDYQTENKISQQENGQPRNVGSEQPTVVQGSYSYMSPEGEVITVNYVADENGFQPEGAHLPTPPPIPEAILKSIQENAAAEASGARSGYSSGYQGDYSGTNSRFSAGSTFSRAGSGFGGQRAFESSRFGAKSSFGGFGNQYQSNQSRQYLTPNRSSYNQKQGGYHY